ncbi:MAG: hypothetical protein ACJAVI_000067 [Candidatus Azotimanducaceae bacterium]|jgi:hypothetical protein
MKTLTSPTKLPASGELILERKLERKERFFDGLAIVLSGTCMLHCLALPILVTLFPIVQGSLLEEQHFHLIMLVLILPTSLIALTVGCRKHKDKLTMALGTIGLVVLAITALFGHELFGMSGERVITSIGGLVLAAAHIRNYLSCRKVDCQHEEKTHADLETQGKS